MATPALSEMFRRLLNKAEGQTRAARSVEYFGWIDLALGIIIFITPRLTASMLHLPALSVRTPTISTLLVARHGLGLLYVVSGRLNAEGFVVASLLDRPLVPAVMAVLWYRGILPGPMAVAFSISDFGGFLWTAFSWRADVRHGENIGGPELQGQSRAAR